MRLINKVNFIYVMLHENAKCYGRADLMLDAPPVSTPILTKTLIQSASISPCRDPQCHFKSCSITLLAEM